MKLSDLGEFGFIERLRDSVPAGSGVRCGIGDDCAALELPPGELLLTTTDMLIEEVHFRRQWTDLRLLGRKSVAVNVSDVAAMGGTPRHLFLGLGIPREMEVEELDAFMAGFLESAARYGACLAGGDTCRSPGPLLISVTAEGSVPEGELVGREGARPGDAVYVSGTLGDSALALRLLQDECSPDPHLARRHHDPEARVGLGRALARAGLPTAMIDLSDGLLADLGHILEASKVGARVDEAALPLSEPFRRASERDPALLELALAGGEDYELLFTVPPDREAGISGLAREAGLPLTRVGSVGLANDGLTVQDRQGAVRRPTRGGFNHFGRK
ncbi:thiamine-phosphate kinase [uncultured Desulfuromonas sp.]|uniref:thiamine-phosphate kinase n=1 Tax=uncultured Desulfuromonas sp. TaxID=181013 RepID=UPI0026369A6C|nr:thiamine-phosphate kinase [uncultured Desulfuromonas sp.]